MIIYTYSDPYHTYYALHPFSTEVPLLPPYRHSFRILGEWHFSGYKRKKNKPTYNSSRYGLEPQGWNRFPNLKAGFQWLIEGEQGS